MGAFELTEEPSRQCSSTLSVENLLLAQDVALTSAIRNWLELERLDR